MKIIAEFCQNHNGDFDTLRRMIDAAVEGGATHGKIQTIFADDLSYRPEFEEGLIDADGNVSVIKRPYKTEYDRLKKLELTVSQHADFVNISRSSGLEPLTTAFNLSCIPDIQSLGWRSVKVASYDCGSLPLIEALSKSFDELIISTGATFDSEIEATANYLNNQEVDFTFLHCVTIYPTPLNQMNLERLSYLQQYSPSVGLSNHSLASQDGIKADLVAIHLGAKVIERHFTVLPEHQTRDGKVSITKDHLVEMVYFSKLDHDSQKSYLSEHIPDYSMMIGTAQRPLSDTELLNRAYYRGRFCNKDRDGSQIYNWEPEARGLNP